MIVAVRGGKGRRYRAFEGGREGEREKGSV